jgi:hypothetical protein
MGIVRTLLCQMIAFIITEKVSSWMPSSSRKQRYQFTLIPTKGWFCTKRFIISCSRQTMVNLISWYDVDFDAWTTIQNSMILDTPRHADEELSQNSIVSP